MAMAMTTLSLNQLNEIRIIKRRNEQVKEALRKFMRMKREGVTDAADWLITELIIIHKEEFGI